MSRHSKQTAGLVCTIASSACTAISLNLRPHTNNYLWISVGSIVVMVTASILLLQRLRRKQ